MRTSSPFAVQVLGGLLVVLVAANLLLVVDQWMKPASAEQTAAAHVPEAVRAPEAPPAPPALRIDMEQIRRDVERARAEVRRAAERLPEIEIGID